MTAPRVGLREFALLLIVALPLVANAGDDPSEIGVVDKVENEANIVSGDNAKRASSSTAMSTIPTGRSAKPHCKRPRALSGSRPAASRR